MSNYGRGRYNFGSSKFYPEVENFSALPSASGHAGHVYLVLNSQWVGIWYHRSGLYRSDGAAWARMANLTTVSDEIFALYDEGGAQNKIAMFECSGIGAATTRIFTFPDASGTLALTSNTTDFLRIDGTNSPIATIDWNTQELINVGKLVVDTITLNGLNITTTGSMYIATPTDDTGTIIQMLSDEMLFTAANDDFNIFAAAGKVVITAAGNFDIVLSTSDTGVILIDSPIENASTAGDMIFRNIDTDNDIYFSVKDGDTQKTILYMDSSIMKITVSGDLDVSSIGTFAEVNIGSVGDAGALLAVGTADTAASTLAGMAEVISDISNPTSNALNSGITIEPYWTNNSGFMLGAFIKTTIDGLAATANVLGVFGGVESVTATSNKSLTVIGLDYDVSHQAAFEAGTAIPRKTYSLTGLRAVSNFGWTGETLSGKQVSSGPVAIGGDFFTRLRGTYSPSTAGGAIDGSAYGLRVKTDDVDSLFDCDVDEVDIDVYGVYIDALTAKAFTGGGGVAGELRSWGLYEANGADNFFAGQVFFGQNDGTIGIYSQADGFLDLFADSGVRIGDSSAGAPSNFTLFEPDGTLTMAGTATVWNDMQFQISDAKVTPAALLPSWEEFTTNTSEYAFSVNDEVDTSANEIPHSWKQGTAGHAHMHITTKAINNVEIRYAKFTVTFAYADIDETWVEAPLTAEIAIANPTAALTNLYLDLGDITLTNYLIASQMRCRVKRIAATTGTEYAGDIFITQIGVHFEEDTIGSRTETVK